MRFERRAAGVGFGIAKLATLAVAIQAKIGEKNPRSVLNASWSRPYGLSP